MLTPEQQNLVVDCLDVADLAVGALLKRYPHFKNFDAELTSAAYEGMCRAAKTYDPKKSSNVRGYFYTAARNGAISEIQRELKKRLIGTLGEMNWVLDGDDEGVSAIECLNQLPQKYREWVEEYVFYGKLKQVREDTNIISGRKIRQMLDDMMIRLRKKLDD